MDEPKSVPTAADLENCRHLLRFITNTFYGATVAGLKVDDLARSLKTVLDFFERND